MVFDPITEQVVQAIAQTVWKREELQGIRQPIETWLTGENFKQLTQEALDRAHPQTIC